MNVNAYRFFFSSFPTPKPFSIFCASWPFCNASSTFLFSKIGASIPSSPSPFFKSFRSSSSYLKTTSLRVAEKEPAVRR